MVLFRVLGILGMLFITAGVICNSKKNAFRRNILFFIGSILLFSYSFYLKDPIFTPLQLIFGAASFYEIIISKNSSKNE